MTNVYIELGRLIPVGEVDKKLEKILVNEDIRRFNKKHPIIGNVFSGWVTSYFTSQGKEKYKPAHIAPCE